MSRCDLSIVLEQPDGRVRAGERLAGFVGVEVSSSVKTRGLHIQLICKTHGRGNRWKKVANDTVVFEGSWEAGTQQLYPFEFDVPHGPVSYDGELLNVSWYVYAYADIAWASDPDVEQEVEVSPSPGRYSQGPLVVYESPLPSTTASYAIAGFTVPFTFVFGLFPWITFGLDSSVPLPVMMFLVVWTGLAWSIGAFLAFSLLRNPLAKRRLGEVELEVVPGELHAGDELNVTLHHERDNPTEVRGVVAVLRAQEVVVSGSGTNKTTHTHIVVEETRTMHEGGRLPSTGRLDATFTLPADAPPSFGVNSNKLEWTVEVRVDIPLWPDLIETRGLRVQPGPRPPAA